MRAIWSWPSRRTVLVVSAAAGTLAPLPASLHAAAEKIGIRSFRCNVPDEQLTHLRSRVQAMRWTEPGTASDASEGAQPATLKRGWAFTPAGPAIDAIGNGHGHIGKEPAMSHLEKVLYTAKVHTTGGRSGVSKSTDGHLSVKLTRPGAPGEGTNPEQLFAAGWSACFESAMDIAAKKMKITLPVDSAIDAEVDLGPTEGAYGLAARLYVYLPGVDRALAGQLLDAAHKLCPYSRATHGNIEVTTTLI